MDLEKVQQLKRRLRTIFVPPESPSIAAPPFSTGIGLTDEDGQYQLAIRLRKAGDAFYLAMPQVQEVLADASGEIDVQVVGPFRPRIPRFRLATVSQTLMIGNSVGHYLGGGGTLGFFAERRSDGQRGFVSCNHVIAAFDVGKHDDPILQPSVVDHGTVASNVVALLDGNYPKLGDAANKLGDCAFAAFTGTAAYDPATVSGGKLTKTPATLTKTIEVTKVGRATNARPGTVKAYNLDDFDVPVDGVSFLFDDVVEVESSTELTFSDPGDSGSLVYTTQTLQPVGLLFADKETGGTYNGGTAWVCDITNVQSLLKVDLVVT